jgi:hypothetical protein
LLGAACGFLACCAAGRLAGGRNPFRQFERFHVFINPATYFYPTASQVRALAEERLGPSKVGVVVGGNSVLYGVGQPTSRVWTRELQRRLGPDYGVVNLALCGACPQEFGALAAEAASRRRPRLIVVGMVGAPDWPGEPDGVCHSYFFWDAYYKGLLTPDPDRDAAVARLTGRRAESPEFGERCRHARLNSAFFFDDLWGALAYARGGALWSPRLGAAWYKPRRKFADPEGGAPGAPCYLPGELAERMAHARRRISLGVCRRDGRGRWVEDPDSPLWGQLQQAARESFPAPFRKRTVLVVGTDSPRYLGQLSADERDHYFAVTRLTARKLEEAGFSAVDMGDGYTEEDFADGRGHLTPAGGAKLAAQVADKVRRVARELGYEP